MAIGAACSCCASQCHVPALRCHYTCMLCVTMSCVTVPTSQCHLSLYLRLYVSLQHATDLRPHNIEGAQQNETLDTNKTLQTLRTKVASETWSTIRVPMVTLKSSSLTFASIWRPSSANPACVIYTISPSSTCVAACCSETVQHVATHA